jgi:hypothetical protein
MFVRRRYFERSMARELVGLALLFSICASFIPLPVVRVLSPEKDQSQPFPCQNRPCGCASAEQCWKQCCCFTNAQKVTWARENGATPPDYVIEAERAALASKVATGAVPPMTDRARGKKSASDCCRQTRSPSQDRTASRSRSDGCRDRGQHANDPAAEDATHYVIGIEMMKCRGQGFSWNSLPWAVIPAIHVPEFDVAPETWERPRSVSLVSISTEPPEPPPRPA